MEKLPNADFYKQVFEKGVPFNAFMGFELLEVREGYVKLRVPYKQGFIGEFRENRLHGGVLLAAVDSAAGIASFTTANIMTDKMATVDLRLDFINPSIAEDVIVEGIVKKSGSRIIFTHALVYHPSNPTHLIAEGRATYSVKRQEKYEDKK
ncbi:MAG: PaaI family thioesterase [Cytophagales bacterium]|nr:MAG: PaaI family thioesterase [Cytophagales bacterium]